MVEHSRQRRRQDALQRNADQEAKLAKIRAKEGRARIRYESGEPPSKKIVCIKLSSPK